VEADVGKQVGEFSFKAITFILTPGHAGTVQMQVTFEGSATGFGLTLGTMTVTCTGPDTGQWTWCAANYPDTGPGVNGSGQGQFRDVGSKRWHTRGLLCISDGCSCLVDGAFDLHARTWSGRLLERE
jgi:hypothetical protein